MKTVEVYYWCETSEAWVRCSEAEYLTNHKGKSFTRIMEGPL